LTQKHKQLWTIQKFHQRKMAAAEAVVPHLRNKVSEAQSSAAVFVARRLCRQRR
jgi:hypothetical protein